MEQTTLLLLAIVGGILPAIVWLWFWLKEDKRRPEPTKRIVITFLAGIISVGVVIPLEHLVYPYVGHSMALLFIVWALIEEVVKFLASYIAALRTPLFDEPIDAPIYLITAALGFAAIENVSFLLTHFFDDGGTFVSGILLGNARFIGATLLHILASSVIGIALALAFYRSRIERVIWVTVGLIIAIILHTGFNYLIIESSIAEKLATFIFIWVAIIILLLFFEKIKRLTQEHHGST